jgi:2-polyprenyl-3-methyl-5-hydroxy-6-metoxy-1,4-benzoquinol methylase
MYKEYEYHSDNLDHISKYIYDSIFKILKPYKNLKILDLGCGNGSLVKLLIENGYDVYGVDASQTGIEIAKRSFPDRFFCLDVNAPLPQNIIDLNFDIIISTEVIEHLYSPKNFIDITKKILRNSNLKLLVISTPYHGYFKNLIISVFNKWDSHWSPEWEGGHIKFWSYNSLKSFLISEGFTDFKFMGCGRLPFLWKSMLVTSKYNAH